MGKEFVLDAEQRDGQSLEVGEELCYMASQLNTVRSDMTSYKLLQQ